MKKFIFATLIAAIFASGCSDDEAISGSITFASDGLYVEALGETVSTTFTSSNVISIEIDDYPDGWIVDISLSKGTVTAQAPTSSNDELEGLVILTGYTSTGYEVVRALNVGIKEFISLESEQANTIMVNTADRVYTIDPQRMGDYAVSNLATPSSCEIVWQSENYPIQHVHLNADGKLSFYTTIDEDDVDGDGSTTDVIDGNAVVCARSSDDLALWTWHIWVCEEPYSEIQVGGYTFMDRNLGALSNSNSTTSDIKRSYGMYYQWGRKEAFNRPAYYNAAGGLDGEMAGQDDYAFEYTYVDSLGSDAIVEYAIAYPETYICATEYTNRDWLYTAEDDLWGGVSGIKTAYDPCPKGWMMPTSEMLEAFTIDEGQTINDSDYGLTLSGGYLFMCYGFRTYLSGRIQNINEEYNPWVGYYWSRDVDGEKAKALAIKWTDTATIGVEGSYRANGMQVRCVKQ